jgi:hypothetical protein
MRSIFNVGALLLTGMVGGAATVSAQVLVPLTVSKDDVRAAIELPGGLGAELTLSFDDAVGLHPGSLEVWATLVDPLDPALLARLPGGWAPPPPTGLLGLSTESSLPPVTIPAALPLLVRIAPSASSALSFSGAYSISLYTHNLQMDPAAPMALLKAHDGGPFSDIMVSEGRGSYRAGGGGGDFSEFLIVVDRRPIDEVIVDKFQALQALLTEHEYSMPEPVAQLLQQRLSLAGTLYEAGAMLGAILEMRAFARNVGTHSGAEIPDVWQASCPTTVNVAGLLKAGADTLRFSLDRKASR